MRWSDDIIYRWNVKKPNSKKQRSDLWLAEGKLSEGGQKVHTFSYKISSNIEHGDCGSRYCIKYFKLAKRFHLKSL